MLKLCLGFLVDTLFCVKWLVRLSIFIHADILVLVSEFLVVVILSEWWLFYQNGGRGRPLPTAVGTSLPFGSHSFLGVGLVVHQVNICTPAMCQLFVVLFCESVYMKLLDAIQVHVYI